MKKSILTLQLVLCVFFLNAQYSPTFDTTHVSLTESTKLKSTIDNENGIYSIVKGTSYSTGNQSILKIERRNTNNELLWSKNISQYYSSMRIIGFDWNNNAYSSNSYGSHYVYRIDKNTGDFIDSVDIGYIGSGLTSLEYLADGNILLRGSRICKLNPNFEVMWNKDFESYQITKINSLIHNNKVYYYVNDLLNYTAFIYVLDLNTGISTESLYIPNGTSISGPKIYDLEIFNNKLYFSMNFVTPVSGGNGIPTAAIFALNEVSTPISTTEIFRRSGTNINGSSGFRVKIEYLETHQDNLIAIASTYANNNSSIMSSKIYILNQLNEATDSISVDNEFTFFKNSTEQFDNLPEPRFKILANALYAIGYKKTNNILKKQILGFDMNLNNVYEFIDSDEGTIESFSYNNAGCFVVSGSIKASTITNGDLYKFCTATASIDEKNPTSFTLFPNPATSNITIQFQNEIQSDLVTIYSISGQKVLQEKITTENNQFHVNTSLLQSGIYFVEVGDARMKFVVE